jgi:hypothetical protein
VFRVCFRRREKIFVFKFSNCVSLKFTDKNIKQPNCFWLSMHAYRILLPSETDDSPISVIRAKSICSQTRVGNLAFLRPNNSILAFLFLVWPWKKCLAYWLYFGFFIKWQEFSLFFSIIYCEGMLNHKATCKNVRIGYRWQR